MAKKAEKNERADKLDECLVVIHFAQRRERSDILAIGEALTTARALLEGDETFTKWVESECDFSRTTAYRYIDAWDAFGKRPRELVELFTSSAIYALSKEKSPNDAIDRAMAYASKKRHRVTKALAESFILAAHPVEKATGAPHVGRDPMQPASSNGKRGTAFDPDTASRQEASAPEDNPADDEEPDREEYEAWEQGQPEPVRPFAGLPELPDDLFEAFENLRLAGLRHKLNGWIDTSLGDIRRHWKATDAALSDQGREAVA